MDALLRVVSKDDNLKHCLDEVICDCGIPQESLNADTEAKGNFLPTFFTAALILLLPIVTR